MKDLSIEGEEKAMSIYHKLHALGFDVTLKSIIDIVWNYAITFKKWKYLHKD